MFSFGQIEKFCGFNQLSILKEGASFREDYSMSFYSVAATFETLDNLKKRYIKGAWLFEFQQSHFTKANQDELADEL